MHTEDDQDDECELADLGCVTLSMHVEIMSVDRVMYQGNEAGHFHHLLGYHDDDSRQLTIFPAKYMQRSQLSIHP